MIFLSHIVFIQFLSLYPQARFGELLFPLCPFLSPKGPSIDSLFTEGPGPGLPVENQLDSFLKSGFSFFSE